MVDDDEDDVEEGSIRDEIEESEELPEVEIFVHALSGNISYNTIKLKGMAQKKRIVNSYRQWKYL